MAVKCALCGVSFDLPADFRRWKDAPDRTVGVYPVTDGGKMSKPAKGFICSRCLHAANSMRLQIKAALGGVKVTEHAIKRFIERSTGDKLSAESARQAIVKMFGQAREIRYQDQFMLARILNNSSKAARYFLHSGWVFVTTETDPKVILTLEPAKRKREGVDFVYVQPVRDG